MAGARKTWKELDAERRALGKPKLSRAELCRRAGISESTVTKGLSAGHVPSKDTRQKVELVLEAERAMRAAGVR